ncbi:glycosyltransferase [Sanguibacteroides justesenii]|uniref:Glycosyl transferase family 1 domain-containing protein n=1 Tax=Sanguibacteroides justesenii TaxID=1547597 RepID=A0AB34R8C0_9PORP|nr:glycosyltransferase [Sanguibacteroides justesenii]KIO46920.1 hypothetical protein IE90_02565 [Sanguibacteroides justesenii]
MSGCFNKKREKVVFCTYVTTFLGGAERRFLRIFSNIPQPIQPIIFILQDKNKIAKEVIAPYISNGVEVRIFSNLFALLFNLILVSPLWVCGFRPGWRLIMVFIVAKLINTKRLLSAVDTKYIARLNSGKNDISLRKLKFCINISSMVDVLYPSALDEYKRLFPRQSFLLTPGSFTDLNIFQAGKKEKWIVFASTLTMGKNPDLYIKAIQLIKDNIVKFNYKCFVCGDGVLYEEMRSLARELECEDIISFTGRVELQNILPKTEIFCSLQDVNNYPSQTLIEAIASGCYCVATNCGDTYRLVKSEFGKLVSSNIQDIAMAVNEAMQFDDVKKEFVANRARQFAESCCTIEKSVSYFSSILRYN